MATPLQPNDLIMMQQTGVSPRVVQSMQTPVVPVAQPVIVQPVRPPVIAAPAADVGAHNAFRPMTPVPANRRQRIDAQRAQSASAVAAALCGRVQT